MAGQHQVDIVHFCPGKLVGRMGEQNTQWKSATVMWRARSKAGRWSVPGKFISSEHDRGAIHLYLVARPTKVDETGGRKRVLQSPLIDMEIVISEDVIDPGAGLKLAERLWNPVEAMFALDDVARNCDDIRLGVIDVFDQVFEIAARQAAG